MRGYRPCMDCRVPTHATRCEPCTVAWRAARDYGAAWQVVRAEHLRLESDCRLCGVPGTEVDHVLPLRDGGTHRHSNLQTLCATCHRRKTAAERDRRVAGIAG